jgi:hypothetical protein
MPISIVVTGRVAGEPIRLLGEDPRVVFVIDPFPGPAGARVAHACEVVASSHDLATWVLENMQEGGRVEVTGELVMERIDGPIEDDLSAVRVWIKASSVWVPK